MRLDLSGDLSMDFWAIQNKMGLIFGVNFGVNFWSGKFCGFCWKPKGFFGVLIVAPIRPSLPLEIRSTPPGSIITYFPFLWFCCDFKSL